MSTISIRTHGFDSDVQNPHTDLARIERRCRLKAEAARWAAERQRRMHSGLSFSTSVLPRDQELIQRAKTTECFLWTNAPSCPLPDDLGLFDVLGSCFDAAADAAELLRTSDGQLDGEDVLLKQCLDAAAEAQSALRSAVLAVDGPSDTDQKAIFAWVKATAAETPVFIERHLRLDDPADPFVSSEIRSRIRNVREACQAVIGQRQRRTRLLNRLRYHAGLVASNGGTDHDHKVLGLVAAEMVRDGVPPSNVAMREAILPIIDSVPQADHIPSEFRLVLREIRRYQDSRRVAATIQEWQPTMDIKTVRTLLQDTSLVLIGGDSREHSRQAIIDAFLLDDLVWLESQEHQSIERFKPYILRPDVKAVGLLIRWASHAYMDLRPFCDRHGKRFCRLPGGYSPNTVARQMVEQWGLIVRP